MKIVNAFWEERNTGLKTCEIIFEKEDKFQNYLEANIESDFKFSVVKIPLGDLKLVHQMEDYGYRFLENQMTLSFEVDQLVKIDLLGPRLLKGFHCEQITTRKEMESVLNEVNNNMFETDRFSLDPFWPNGLSSKRYFNWIRELFESEEAQFYVIIRDGKGIGFFSIKRESKSTGSCPIAGIYNSFKTAGYIFVLTWFWLHKSQELGYKKLITSISSNNRLIISSLSRAFSFRISDTSIVLRKVIN